MKKNCYSMISILSWVWECKIFFIMRLAFLVILLCVLQSFAIDALSQNQRLSINQKNISVENVMQMIENQTDFYFMYSALTVDVKRTVDIEATDKSVSEVLDDLFKETGIAYKIKGRMIALSGKSDSSFMQQYSNVSGKVTDSSGAPLPGVTVSIKGTAQGTITDPDGNYSLSGVPPEAILQFSFIGMKTQAISVSGKPVVNMAMEEDAIGIEEVVAIGYGSAKKSDITGAMGSVRSEEIARTNPVQPTSALQGTVAGVNVNKQNSRPGAEYTIDIRGLHSIDYSNEPLVVIDGVMGGRLSSLNPSDIESMDVLKDASATAIYGARGANGVIIVTTKKGTSGKTKVTYDGYVGVKVPSNLPDLMTAQEFYHAYNDVIIAEKPGASPVWTTAELANVEAGKSTDWVDLVTDPSVQTSHVVALSGGNENATHYFSAGYLNEKGNLLYTEYERFNLKGSMESNLNDVVKVGFNSYFTYSIQNLGSNESLRAAYRVKPTGTVFYDDLTNPSETSDKNVDGYAFWMGIKDKQIENPLIEVQRKNYQDETRTSSFLGNGYIELTPVKGFSFKSSLSTSALNSRHGVYKGTDTKSRINKLPTASNSFQMNTSWTWDNILNYKLKTGLHDFNITAAQSALKERFESAGTNVENLPYNSKWYAFNTAALINSTESALIERSILSFMGRINYIFDNRYLLTLTGRYDGSSVLADGNKWAFFPSIALAWRAGEEQFIKNLSLFSDLKVRLSYGQVGNDVVQPYSTQAYLGKTAYDFDGTEAYGYTPNNIGNADLKWENSAEVNFGVNMGFLKNRIRIDAEYYNKKTDDLIQNVALPTSLGYESVTANVGKLVNRGVEISINSVNVQKTDFSWNTTLNFSTNHNEILELYGGTVTRDIANNLFVGESLRTNYYYEFDGIWQLDEADEAAIYGQVPGSVKVVDQNNDGKISSAADADDRVVLGNELPKWIGGVTNSFTYKNWDFSFMVYTRQGVQFRNSLLSGTMGELGSSRYNRLNLNYWTEDNPTNDYFGVWQSNPYRQAIQYKDASFWRISNLTLGYKLPEELLSHLNFASLRCYIQANNLAVFTKEKNIWMDPEFNSGTYGDDVPNSTFIFGINLSF